MIAVDQDQQRLQKKAATLVEGLPYMRKYAGEIFVIKYGGHAMVHQELARHFAEDVALLNQVGIHPVIVHGGGPQIGRMLERLGIESRFVDGLRVTDEATAEVAEMVLCGKIRNSIVADINTAGARAVGLSGKDGGLMRARRQKGPSGEDLGFVGQPSVINPYILTEIIEAGGVPVISPIAPGSGGKTYNINADTMAGAIASALEARRFFLLTDVPGVLGKEGELLTELTAADVTALKQDGTISGGMIPKVDTCTEAVASGVKGAVILDGRLSRAMLLEIFTERGIGTLIR